MEINVLAQEIKQKNKTKTNKKTKIQTHTLEFCKSVGQREREDSSVYWFIPEMPGLGCSKPGPRKSTQLPHEDDKDSVS